MKIRESDIEAYLVEQVKHYGGFTRKLKWVGYNGAPDRLVVLRGQVFFIELKAPGKFLAPIQEQEAERMRKAGARVFKADSKLEIDTIVRGIVNE